MNLFLNISADIGSAHIFNFQSVYLKNLCNQLCSNDFKELCPGFNGTAMTSRLQKYIIISAITFALFIN